MSKKWKVVVGVIAAAVVVVGIALPIWGMVAFRSRDYERGWAPGTYRWEPEVATRLEVDLVDDDGDGVPDRGVIDVPTAVAFGPDCGRPFVHARGGHFGRGFGPGRGLPFGPAFGPFLIVGGLFHLAFLALLIGLAVFFFRRWFGPRPRWAHPPGPHPHPPRTYPPAPDTFQQEE
jgi:hypothetical protein